MKRIEILGPGCAKCHKLAEVTQEAANELKLECEIVKVTDIQQIVSRNVLMTPALVVDGAVKCSGRVPSLSELKTMLS
ncbi:MAG TPA: thioredoxin family protein [bacterium]|nr:thioredoxin family protein [bacterium]